MERAGAAIVYGSQDCDRHCTELMEELGFPRGVLPLKDLVECGRVRETGFVWMKQKAPCDHMFQEIDTRVSYAAEVTAYVEKGKMKKMTGVKSKKMMVGIPISEMSIDETNPEKIVIKTSMGVSKSFPITAFMTNQEKEKFRRLHGQNSGAKLIL